jgi:Helix-turn-helix domain
MNPTDLPVTAAAVSATPEFVDHHGGRTLFSISRSSLYRLAEDGKIRSVCLRNRGKLRGRRLFDCDSIRQFLRGQMEASGQ